MFSYTIGKNKNNIEYCRGIITSNLVEFGSVITFMAVRNVHGLIGLM